MTPPAVVAVVVVASPNNQSITNSLHHLTLVHTMTLVEKGSDKAEKAREHGIRTGNKTKIEG